VILYVCRMFCHSSSSPNSILGRTPFLFRFRQFRGPSGVGIDIFGIPGLRFSGRPCLKCSDSGHQKKGPEDQNGICEWNSGRFPFSGSDSGPVENGRKTKGATKLPSIVMQHEHLLSSRSLYLELHGHTRQLKRVTTWCTLILLPS